MNSGSGIQELMAAETRASQIVAEARIGQFIKIKILWNRKNPWRIGVGNECCHVFLVLTRHMIIAAVTLYYYLSDVCEGSSILPSLMYSRLSLKHIILTTTQLVATVWSKHKPMPTSSLLLTGKNRKRHFLRLLLLVVRIYILVFCLSLLDIIQLISYVYQNKQFTIII